MKVADEKEIFRVDKRSVEQGHQDNGENTNAGSGKKEIFQPTARKASIPKCIVFSIPEGHERCLGRGASRHYTAL
jgi:hypothetical protein